MNKHLKDYLERKMSDSARGGDSRRDSKDYRDGYEDGYADSRRDYMSRGDSRRSMRDNRGMRDSEDERLYRGEVEVTDHRDMHDVPARLSKHDMKRWKQMLENVDGTRGPHYDMVQTMQAAEKLGIRFDEYDEGEFCLAVNMMYADYGQVVKKHAGGDKELMCCAELAKAFLEDPDGPDPSEKLALYFHCIVDA